MFPKQIAFFWSGGPLSWLRYLSLKTFCDFNPDWKVCLYVSTSLQKTKEWQTFETQDFLNYSGTDWMPEVLNLPVEVKEASHLPQHLDPIHQCDMFQWWWLSEWGGWYADLDILFLKSMDSLCNHASGRDMVFSLPRGDLTIGFLGCNQGNKFYAHAYQACIAAVEQGILTSNYQSFGSLLLYSLVHQSHGGPALREVSKKYAVSFYLADSAEDVYPWNWTQLENIWLHQRNVPESQLGIHWYAGAPVSQKMNSTLTPDNFELYPCTLTNYISKII